MLQSNGIAEGFVVYSRVQTRGHGRWGREWWSPEGGVWCSLVIPKVSIPSLRATFSVVRVIRMVTALSARIKWPNDVVIRGKKVAGVLTEEEGDKLIVGIGVNVNQEYFPNELCGATSLKIETGKVFKIDEILQEIMKDFELNLTNPIIVDQIRETIALLGEEITVKVRDGVKTGKFWDIGADGSLLLREDTGIIKELTPAEVEFIR